ncbi:MAG: ankyrin repeat domain-containing protein, partial [Candidatus Thorarchaeota archaeon]
YDAGADKPCGSLVHENKNFYPHYELMWEVNPMATRQFIESFWSGHIRDWSNLDMDRHCYQMNQVLEEAWKHEYKGGPVFFKPKQGIPASFITTAGGLIHGAATLTKLSGDSEPLVWAKRLASRYVETRNPKTGIGTGIYTGEQTNMSALKEIKDVDLNELSTGSFFPALPTSGNSDVRQRISGYFEVSPGIPFNGLVAPWICALLAGEMMGSEGRELIQWSVEELTAWGKVAYRKRDNSWIPMLRDGTSLEGLVIKKDGSLGTKGTIVVPVSVIPMEFWAYALAYQLTENDHMWQMARNIALGNGFGDIGISPLELPKLEHRTSCADPYALMGYLELYEKTQCKPFLFCAKQIGDNILTSRFHKGFIAPSNKHIYAKFDSPESLALLHLHASSISTQFDLPTTWPSKPFFEHPYRDKDSRDDNSLIYSLTESPEAPISLQEAAARGNLDLVKSLIEDGIEVDYREDGFCKTALHRAAMSGHRDVVQYLLANGAQVDAWNNFPGGMPLHYAAEQGHKEIAELLIAHGADINAKDVQGRTPIGTPIDLAIEQGHREIAKLLLIKSGDVSIHMAAYIGDLQKVEKFIDDGTDADAKDQQGQTALHYAAKGGEIGMVEFLISKGTDVNAKDNRNFTPLHEAVRGKHENIIALLIDSGANVNVKARWDYTPMYYAAWSRKAEIVELLVKKGADINAKDEWDWTPLHYIAQHDYYRDMAEFLITKGADVNAKDKWGVTPLEVAKEKGHTEIVELLKKNGAKE